MDMRIANPAQPGGRKRYGILIILMAMVVCVNLAGCGSKKPEPRDTRQGGDHFIVLKNWQYW
jgi:hypothetical protein